MARSLASTASSGTRAGRSCAPIHSPTPAPATASISPGRGPKARRLRTCNACLLAGHAVFGRVRWTGASEASDPTALGATGSSSAAGGGFFEQLWEHAERHPRRTMSQSLLRDRTRTSRPGG